MKAKTKITDFMADPVFLKVAPLVLKSESGYANLKGDPGGPTMRGVAWNYNADWLKANTAIQRADQIRNLTKEEALWCYFDRYWAESGGRGITDVDLAYIHFDCAINCGVGTAGRMLKRLSKDPRNFDFSNGKNRTLALQLFLEYTANRLDYYTDCRNRDHFLEGWVNRIVEVIRNSFGLD